MQLAAENIVKVIKGRIILDHVDLCMESGRVYGIVGRNGSGKTMLFRALSGLMSLNEGQVSCDGKILHRDMSVLPSLGIVLENAGLYPGMTGFQNLKKLSEVKKLISDDQIREAITRVGLDPKDRRTYRKYSLGMKQRIVLAQAIMEKPEILMLDEPTNALDEQGVEEIRQVIMEEKDRGALVLLASHNKEDIQKLADEVFYMENGRLVRQEEVSDED